MEFVDLQKLL
jgi:hypothetical protein